MIGFYDYTVVLTYVSLFISVFGMTLANTGNFRMAILCLALSGLCDMFDGKIARTKKERSADEKLFGMQIDSLCDVVCFGAFPALICYMLGVRGVFGILIIGYYCICSVIRLAFFNVLETNRQQVEDGANKYYHGLPITSMAIVLPLVFMLQFFIPDRIFILLLHITLVVVGTLFIVDFQLKKPGNHVLLFLVLVVAAAVVIVLVCSHFKIPKMHFDERSILRWLSHNK